MATRKTKSGTASGSGAASGGADAAQPTIPKATPATQALGEAGIPYALHSYGDERGVGCDPRRVFDTVIVETERGLVAAVVPLGAEVDLDAIAFALGFRTAKATDAAAASAATGYPPNNVAPLGLSEEVRVVVDTSMPRLPSVLIASGLPGLDVEVRSSNLINITGARAAPITQRP
ncbi:MAG: Cys-tRNA(Pro) deacylase [Actinomycetia bacterium]|nr:Cys-tRNA(Pro) deacylase [Actinomycetes bacterium]